MIENPKWDGKGRRLTQLNENDCSGVWHKQGRGLYKARKGHTRNFRGYKCSLGEKKGALARRRTVLVG